MKKVSLRKNILVVLMIMVMGLLSLTSYATDEVKETKVTVSEQEESTDSETRTMEEIEKEMKKGIVGIGDTEDEEEEESGSIFDFKLEDEETVNEKLTESAFATGMKEGLEKVGKALIYILVGGLALLIAFICFIVFLVKRAKQPKKEKVAKTQTVKENKKVEEKEDVPYQQEQYEVYAKEDSEKFDKEYEKAEASAYKTLEANGYELPNEEDDDFDMNTVGVATPIETEELTPPVEEDDSNLTPEDKLNKFVKRIESKKEVQQKLFDEALPNQNKKAEVVEEVIAPVAQEKEESLLGFDYEEEKVEEPAALVVEEKEESLLGFDYEEEAKVEEVKAEPVEAPLAPVVQEKEEVKEEKETTSFSRPAATSTSRKTNRFSFVELPQEGEEEKKEETKPSSIGFKRKGTAKKVEVPEEKVEEVKEEKIEETVVKEEKTETPANPTEEIDFFAEMEANMKKSKEEREKNKK